MSKVNTASVFSKPIALKSVEKGYVSAYAADKTSIPPTVTCHYADRPQSSYHDCLLGAPDPLVSEVRQRPVSAFEAVSMLKGLRQQPAGVCNRKLAPASFEIGPARRSPYHSSSVSFSSKTHNEHLRKKYISSCAHRHRALLGCGV